jgi:hypothetical protein
MIDPEVVVWAKAFCVTTAVEVPLVAWALRHDDPSAPRRAALAFSASLLTHPAVAFVFPRLGLPGGVAIVLAESWAVGLEAVFYALVFRGLGPARALAISALANAASFGVGLLLGAVGTL